MKFFLSGLPVTLTGILLFVGMGSLSAQTFVGSLNPYPETVENYSIADDTLKILAVMVNFLEDADGTTFGNGKFGSIYTQNYGNNILDPLPHDKAYFESHLQFVKNYFSKVSKGKLEIEFKVLTDTFSVSDRMRNYSPEPGSDDFAPLGSFAVEAWELADQMYPAFNFKDYDVFLIFHAGVGRDISLPGSIGNERDLPSVYLSLKAFKEFYGESFEGISVSGGAFKITNSMIIPETESRELQTISGTALFEISINGLLCASIASHLGVPDLFDTETGLSAIGRFGLMDGQSIFAYLGTYPPEPSPWSKLRLGWADAVTMDLRSADVSLVTNLAATMSDTVILKIPLNSTEYFLIENRIRDANNDGSKVTLSVGGNVITKTFLNDTTGYQSFDVDSLAGVILDVDEFDWAVPGNGIVVWHVDENVINEKIAENKINTDKTRRGIDIEEADGVQDIGETFITIFGDEVIGEGTNEDFWYASNPAELYQNLFNKETRPNTKTNTGANSLITIKDFSEINNRINFKVEFGDSVVKPLFSYNFQDVPMHLSTTKFQNENYVFVNNTNSFNILLNDSLHYSTFDFSIFKPAVTVENNLLFVFGNYSTNLTFWITDGTNQSFGQVTVPHIISTPLSINKSSLNEVEIWFGASNGKIYKYSVSTSISSPPELKDSIDIGIDYTPYRLAVYEDFYAVVSYPSNRPVNENTLFTSPTGSVTLNDVSPASLAITKNSNGNFISIIFTQQGFFYTIVDVEVVNSFNSTSSITPNSFSVSDLKRDGNNYISMNSSTEIVSYNLNGSIGDNFPVEFEDEFVGTMDPVSVDFEGDDNSEIIGVTYNGSIFAVDGGSGKLISGFPISIGDTITTTPSIFNYDSKTGIVVGNKNGLVQAWTIGSVEGEISWKEEFANSENSSFIPAAKNTNRINEFFPTNRAYNYPNPVYEGTTNIRYYVSEDSKINIKIFDLAGDFVAELNDEAQGGMDNETIWNVVDIQSGVYFARIEASSTSGKTEQAVIKIAVVK